MKKKSLSFNKCLPSVTLYLDDIEELVSILGENGRKVTIESSGYEYDSLDELVSHSGKFSCFELSLRTYNPGFSITIKRREFWGASVFLHSATEEYSGTFYRLLEFLKKRTNKLSSVLHKYLFWVFLFILFNPVTLDLLKKYCHSLNTVRIIYIGLFLLILLTAYVNTGFATRLYLKKRSELPNLFVRKKDDILLLIMGAVVGAAISVFVQKLWERII